MAENHSSGERFTTILFYGVLILLAYLLYRVFEPFLVPLGWAGVLVVVFYPLHARLERRLGKTRAAALSTAGVTLILIVPALLLGSLFVREGVGAVRSIQQTVAAGQVSRMEHAWQWIELHARIGDSEDSNAHLPAMVKNYAERAVEYLASQLGVVLRNTALFFFDLFVTLFALFYFFRDAGKLVKGLRRLLPFDEQHRERMLEEARELIYASVTTSLLIAGVQGVLCGIGFAVVGLQAAVFWGVLMAFTSLVPIVGSALIWGPAAIWLVATGHIWRAIVLLAICAGLSTLVDNFLRPILISGRTRLDGLLVFISVFGGIAVFGALGLVLGPMVVAMAASLFEAYADPESSG
jgi:predicted PurR-regulated permease PerM